MLQPAKVIRGSVTSSDSFDFCNKSQLEKQRLQIKVFTSLKCTRVSVYVGCGACPAVLVPLPGDDDKYPGPGSKAAGKNVAALTCELKGIPFGLEIAIRYFESSKYRKHTENLYILCDCLSATDVIVNRLYNATRFEQFTRLAHFQGIQCESKKVAPQKLFAIFSLVVNLCN